MAVMTAAAVVVVDVYTTFGNGRRRMRLVCNVSAVGIERACVSITIITAN